jgi:tetratricopeptide (TPR) repeat protein
VNSDPEDIYYRYWLNVYKYRALGGKPDPYNEEIVIDDAQLPQVHEIVKQLRQICMLCPTFGPAYSTLGQIEKYVLYDESGSDRINRGFYLAKNNPVICFVAACSDASEGDIDSAQQKFTRAIRLDGRLYKKAAMICIDHLSRPDLAVALAGENIRHLHNAHTALDEAQYTDYAQQVRDKIITLLEEKCTSGTAVDWEHRLLGIYYKKEGENEKAIECYRNAVKMNYSKVRWRFELADLLAKSDKIKQAMDEAKICLQLSPGFTAAKNLLADCSIQPVILNEAVK